VDEACAHRTAVFEAEAPHDLEGVVVAVPDRDALVAEARRDLARRTIAVRERERRDAAVHREQPVQREGVWQSREEALAEGTLVSSNRIPAD
jgi:hypothetical protein